VAKERENKPKTKDQLRIEQAQREKPPLSRILKLKDLEVRDISPCGSYREADIFSVYLARCEQGIVAQGLRVLFLRIRR
jgi:hypothetical protein